jgi:hypothetical protein
MFAAFSNVGIHSVHITAPGQKILSTFPGNSYAKSAKRRVGEFPGLWWFRILLLGFVLAVLSSCGGGSSASGGLSRPHRRLNLRM